MVTCPVCLGSKISPITGDVCKCCNGVGEITNETALAKSRIRADLSSRLTKRAPDLGQAVAKDDNVDVAPSG